MKIALEGTTEEVMGMMRSLVGGADNATTLAVGPPAEAPEAAAPAAMESLVRSWADGFDLTGSAHWDADAAEPSTLGEELRQVAISRTNGAALRWVASQGGLTAAVHSLLAGDTKVSRGVAVNMAQVASIFFPDLSDLLEHFDPFED